MSQADLALKLGVSRNYVSMIEGGREPSESLWKLFGMIEESPLYPPPLSPNRLAETPNLPCEKIRAAREAAGATAAQFAKSIGYPLSLLQNIEAGRAPISEKMARAIVRALPELSLDDLLDGSDSPRVLDESGLTGTVGATPTITLPGRGRTRYVPMLSWAAAGALANAAALDEGYSHEGVACNLPGRVFAVAIRGDSMEPDIKAGDHAFIRADEEPRVGSIVLVRTLSGDVLCKRLQTKDGGKLLVLSSINRSYEPIEILASQVAWIYPVKQVIRTLE